MKGAAFQELMRSVRQAGRIRRGRLKASRTTAFTREEVKAIRENVGQHHRGWIPRRRST
jgi:putative transcriptional regulator